MSDPQIRVTLTDANTGRQMAQTHLPADRLPESFAAETTMHIAGEHWRVVFADPMTREEALRRGELRLSLAKAAVVPTKDILYTLPTICPDLPRTTSHVTAQGMYALALRLHEDDWRQIELISASYDNTIGEELAGITRVFQTAGKYNGRFWGFRDIYRRQTITAPLRPLISLKDLAAQLPLDTVTFAGVSYQESNGLIERGFAFDLGGLAVYGVNSEGLATVLGISRIHDGQALRPRNILNAMAAMQGLSAPNLPEVPGSVCAALAALMVRYELRLVDWCAMRVIPATGEAIWAHFNHQASES